MAKVRFDTKRGNYLLRSTRRDNLLDLMALVEADRLAVGMRTALLVNSRNEWVGNAEWAAKMLVDHGFIEIDTTRWVNGRRVYRITDTGQRAFTGALVNLNVLIDVAALLKKLDTIEVN